VNFVFDFGLDGALLKEFFMDVRSLRFTFFKIFIEGLELVVLFQLLQFLLPVQGIFMWINIVGFLK